MRAVKSLAQIAREQVVLAERISIAARLAAGAIVVGYSILSGAGGLPALIVDALVLAVMAVLSLLVGLAHRRGTDTERLFPAVIAIDSAAALAAALFSLGASDLGIALPVLMVCWTFTICLTLVAGLRLAVRDTILTGSLAAFVAVLAVAGALVRFPGPAARSLLIIPILSAMCGALATVVCRRNVAALEDNLITEDLLKASRRLKMTMDIVTASIFNLHQFITKLVEVSTTVSQGARNQAAGIEQVTGTAERLQKSLEDISRSSETSAATIGRAARFSESGTTIMQKVIDEILGIHEVMERMVAALARINDIADQTNLLALNAAIEASRAGDERSGFSVVADEIRQLAEKSSETAGEVSKWVKQIVTVIDSGGESSREAGTIFNSIAKDLGTHAGFIGALAGSVKDQLGEHRAVTAAIERIRAVVARNTTAADTVGAIVLDLQKEMLKLEALVGDKVQEAEKLSGNA
ncbi:MAG: methyl-accepting chemotaxis protein [Spirochaetes bacterium]|nr:methyl-accepting chemotaxis protein [Spirochaetota bacterium]